MAKHWKDYYLELEMLRAQIQKKKEERANFEYIEVRYFDLTDGLPEDNIELLNIRLQQAKDTYNLLLSDLWNHYEAC